MFVEGKRILITGSNGFIGRNLIYKLRDFNVKLGLVTSRKSTGFQADDQIFVGNIGDQKFIQDTVGQFKPQIVYHLAANKSRTYGDNTLFSSIETNFLGSLNIYNSLIGLDYLDAVVAFGTIDEYGDADVPYFEEMKELPLTGYGFSKMLATKLGEFFHRTAKLPITILRPSIAYGPLQGNEMFVPSLINSLLRDEDYLMTPGEQKRDFIFIADLVNLIIGITGNKDSFGKTFNVGSGNSVKLCDVAKLIAKILKKEKFLKMGALDYRLGERMEYSISNDAVRRILDWSPTVGLEKGLLTTIEHYRSIIDG